MNDSKIYAVFLVSLMLLSCVKKETYFTQQELQFKTDSIIRSKMEKLEQAAKEDFNRRLPIELKVKLDSIFQVSYAIPAPPRLAATGDSANIPANSEIQPADSSAGS